MTLATKPGQQAKAWQALALAWAAGDRQPALYLDGTAAPVASATQIASSTTALTAITGPLVVGAGSADFAAGGWQGLVDEVRVRPASSLTTGLRPSTRTRTPPTHSSAARTRTRRTGRRRARSRFPWRSRPWSTTSSTSTSWAAPSWLPDDEPVLTGVSQPDHGIASVIGGKVRYTDGGLRGARQLHLRGGRRPQGQHRATRWRSTGSPRTCRKRSAPCRSGAPPTSPRRWPTRSPGDHIVLADGAYAGGFVATCPAPRPTRLYIRAANPLGAKHPGQRGVERGLQLASRRGVAGH